MAQLRASPNNLRNNLRDRGRGERRVRQFLDERRDRERPRRNNGRNDREREDERRERHAQDLRDDDDKTLKDYLQVLATDRESISTQLQELDLRDGEYMQRSAYKYGRPTQPTFTGSEATFIDFIRECIAWCRVKKVPNYLQHYLFQRVYPQDWSEEEVIADRELYGMFDSWLGGSAKSFTMNRLQLQSGHLVFADLIEKFLARSPQKKQQISMDLNNIQFQDESIRAVKTETIPQFFTRARTLQFRFLCIGGECSEDTLVQHCASGLMAHPKLYSHVSQILDASPGCDTFFLETTLLNKITLNHTVQKKKAASANFACSREAHAAYAPQPAELCAACISCVFYVGK